MSAQKYFCDENQNNPKEENGGRDRGIHHIEKPTS
jgi:hypothetical protein